ncbi:hypothetical protein CRG98_029852 [Punica granatum]|uniref:Uncharacterized protein n=1 Tax=Punica granatum TaxID=22663 RepID=A0A2I0J237_PUNGR|nr:hypothetical protein CRG98_029852 [Punica granatum]
MSSIAVLLCSNLWLFFPCFPSVLEKKGRGQIGDGGNPVGERPSSDLVEVFEGAMASGLAPWPICLIPLFLCFKIGERGKVGRRLIGGGAPSPSITPKVSSPEVWDVRGEIALWHCPIVNLPPHPFPLKSQKTWSPPCTAETI